jgi:hypothetical protein
LLKPDTSRPPAFRIVVRRNMRLDARKAAASAQVRPAQFLSKACLSFAKPATIFL